MGSGLLLKNHESLTVMYAMQGYQPKSPFSWSSGSAFGKQTCVTPVPSNPKVPSSRRILQNVGGKRLASEASAGNCSQRPTSRRGLVKKRRCVILSQESKEEQPVDIGPPVDRVRATDRSQESGFAQGQAQVQRLAISTVLV
eukprot:TRINITY_DN2362_c0_g2_i1.p1 TRINITY_DN2362_c0_g2~~TRINITY_DN2362_c0_g2_i1.p1  ORF type:complete len:142 (+),score=8.75 TRINITY_DN2362_c0_g2_i1:254-679(+)